MRDSFAAKAATIKFQVQEVIAKVFKNGIAALRSQ